MFSRAKRFNYPEPEDLSQSLSECSRNHPVYTPRPKRARSVPRCSHSKPTPKPEKRLSTPDFDVLTQNLQRLQRKMENHMVTSTESSGFSGSSRTSSPPSELEVLSWASGGVRNMDELCENIADLVLKKMMEKKEKSLWQKGKELWKSVKKTVLSEERQE